MPLPSHLDHEHNALLNRLNKENTARHPVVSRNAFAIQLRTLKAICQAPARDPTGSERKKHSARILAAMAHETWISADLANDIGSFLQKYVEWTLPAEGAP